VQQLAAQLLEETIAMTDALVPNDDYAGFLEDLKQRVRSARTRAALAVNAELVLLYWSIGRDILTRMAQHGWGAKTIDRLADDLRLEFPDMKGFSPRNLRYMRSFAEAWPDEPILQGPLAKLPWYHNLALLEKLKDPAEREWYARAAIENGWSRNIMVHQIGSDLYHRQGKAVSNFERVLPAPQSDLAAQILKDPYNFDFLSLADDAHERDLHRGLMEHIRDFLIELGVGFAFVGSQVHLEVGGEDFYLDLLFYHLRLRCLVVVDLKVGDFKPEFAGKMNFYLSALDDQMRHPDDQPPIGLLLCHTRNRVIAEYALRDIHKPLGVSTYQLQAALPDNLKGSLPSIEELEAELDTTDSGE
jgi:predicted nuclease of restriction endonuclease-like (RecB) superfamily